MYRKKMIYVFVGVCLSTLMFESCRKEHVGAVVGSSERSALDHAYECESVLGPLPRFSCADAIEVPTTKNGTPVTFPPGEVNIFINSLGINATKGFAKFSK